MNNERLLSELEIEIIENEYPREHGMVITAAIAQDAKTIAALIAQILDYATDYYSLSAWDFAKKYPDIETDVSDGQWIAQYLKKLKESI